MPRKKPRVPKSRILLGLGVLLLLFCIAMLFHAYNFTHSSNGPSSIQREGMQLSVTNRIKAAVLGVRPVRHNATVEPAALNLPYENVSFNASDGVQLQGWLIYPAQAKATVMFGHGYNANRGSLKQDKLLDDCGFAVLMFDFRGTGESGGNVISMGYGERHDVLGAARYLRQRQDTKETPILGLGVSMGGAAMIFAEADEPIFSAMAGESVYPSLHQNIARRFKAVYGLPKFPFATALTFFGGLMLGTNGLHIAPENAIKKMPIPRRIIQGTDDESVSVADAKRLFANAPEPKNLWIVEGATHAGNFSEAPQLYEEKVVRFFEISLQSSPECPTLNSP